MHNLNNITFLTSGLNKGGSERVISIFANNLSSKGRKISIVSIRNTGCSYEIDSSVDISFLSKLKKRPLIPSGPFSIFKNLIMLKKKLNKLRSKTIIAFGPPASAYAVLTKLFLKRNIIVTIRNNPHRTNLILKLTTLIFYRFADLIILQNEQQLNWLRKLGINNDMTILNNPIKVSHDKNPYFANEKNIDFLIVGNFRKRKNQLKIIKAFLSIKNKLPENCQMHFAGRPISNKFFSEVENFIKDNHLTKNVKLLGNVDDIAEIYKNSKIHIIFSDQEGQPNCLIEAMSFGIPSISSDWSGYRGILNDRKNAIIVPRNDIQSLSNEMLKLHKDNQLRKQISNQSFADIKNNFDINVISEKLLMHIESLNK